MPVANLAENYDLISSSDRQILLPLCCSCSCPHGLGLGLRAPVLVGCFTCLPLQISPFALYIDLLESLGEEGHVGRGRCCVIVIVVMDGLGLSGSFCFSVMAMPFFGVVELFSILMAIHPALLHG